MFSIKVDKEVRDNCAWITTSFVADVAGKPHEGTVKKLYENAFVTHSVPMVDSWDTFYYQHGILLDRTLMSTQGNTGMNIPLPMLADWQQRVKTIILENRIEKLTKENEERYSLLTKTVSGVLVIEINGDDNKIELSGVKFSEDIIWKNLNEIGFVANGKFEPNVLRIRRRRNDYLTFTIVMHNIFMSFDIHNHKLGNFIEKMKQ